MVCCQNGGLVHYECRPGSSLGGKDQLGQLGGMKICRVIDLDTKRDATRHS